MLTDLLNQVVEQNQPEACMLNGFDSYKFTQSGKAYTIANVTQAGRVAKIKVYQGNGQQLMTSLIGQVLTFNVKSYRAQNGNIYISGFWQDKVPPNNNLPAQQPPQQAYQPPQQSPQATNSTQGGNIVKIAERIAVALEKIAEKGNRAGNNEEPSTDADIPF